MKRTVLFYLLLVMTCYKTQLSAQTSVSQDYLKSFNSQLYFEENLGQYNDSILFQTHMLNRQIRFLEFGPSYAEVRELDRDPSPNNPEQRKFENYSWLGEREAEHEALVWNTSFLNTSNLMRVQGEKPIPGTFNYFRGVKNATNATGVRRYAELWYRNIYDQIDLRYYGTESHAIKYDFVLKVGADVDDIELKFSGIESFEIDEAGKLIVHTSWGDVIDAAPYSYQMGYEGEMPVEVVYRKIDDVRLGFEIVGDYDENKTLVLDPLTLSWATYFHSSSSDDYVMAVDMDADENVYIAGYTKSTTFPVTPGSYENIYGGGIDCYVAKLSAGGTTPVYATYLGGSDWEMAYGLRINAAREVFVAGFGASTDFPTTASALQTVSEGGGVDGFITRLSVDGDALIYSTYMGGTDRDYIYDLEVNAGSEAYVTGYTYSSDYPTTIGAYSPSYTGNGDAMITRLSADGSSMVFSTLYGGINYDIANSISLGASDEVYIAGNTASINLPLSTLNIQDTLNYDPGLTIEDAFLAKLSADGSSLEYATYLGGSDSDGAYGMDVSATGEVFITGTTYSGDFPVTAAALQNSSSPNLGSGDVFVAKIDVPNNALDYATYVAGSDIDFVKSLVVNSYGEAHIMGATRSDNWPTTAGAAGHSDQYDLFITVLNADGSSLIDSDLYGGSYNDYPRASGSLRLINEQLILAATTHSPDIPLTGVTYQSSKTNGLADSPWIGSITIDITLPVELNAFDIAWNQESESVSMEWLAYEAEVEGIGEYVIERRLAGKNWEAIGSQKLQSADEIVSLYQYQDADAINHQGKELVYRVKYQGAGGSLSYSLSKSLVIPDRRFKDFQLYPNPVSDRLTLEIETEKEQTTIGLILYDFMGRVVLMKRLQTGASSSRLKQEFDVSHLGPGIYHMQVWDDQGKQIVENIIKN